MLGCSGSGSGFKGWNQPDSQVGAVMGRVVEQTFLRLALGGGNKGKRLKSALWRLFGGGSAGRRVC